MGALVDRFARFLRSDDGIVASVWHRGPQRPARYILATQSSPRYRLCYEKTRLFVPLGLPWRSHRVPWQRRPIHRQAPVTLLEPSLAWHVNGRSRSVSNPCLVELPDGRWRLGTTQPASPRCPTVGSLSRPTSV